jgi:hypothetical protein
MSVTTPDHTIVRLHRLTMVPEDDGVMIGRPDIASYAMFPEEGAEMLRMLGSGVSIGEAAAWYEEACGEPLDVEDFLDTLGEFGFLLAEGEEPPAETPVRWRRLARWTFSPVAWVCYAALIAGAVAAMIDRPALRPSYHDAFFTSYLILIPITITIVQTPYILLHEAYHSLAGRRLGLNSGLNISRRFFYLVAETRLDTLFSVPRRKRYLPFLAGMLIDIVAISALTLLSLALEGHGIPRWIPLLCLAMSFTCVLRLVWQLMFYLETDLYFLITNALHCSELQSAARHLIKVRIARLLHREIPEPEQEWSERDLAMAPRYAPLLIAGYGFSLGSLLWAGLPTMGHFFTLIDRQLRGTGRSTAGILDALSFLLLMALQGGLLLYVTVRDRRARNKAATLQGALT